MTTTATPETTAAFTRRERLLLLLLLGAGFMVSLDFSILNVALPQVGRGVGLTVRQYPWIATAYALPSAGFALLFGRIADAVGRRRIFMLGLTVLILASILGGMATTPTLLLTARTLQGFATAMTLPATMALLTTSFAEGPVRDRALGFNGALLSGGFTMGALVGGVLVSTLGWRAVFFLNVPVCLGLAIATPRVIEESRSDQRQGLDVPGAVLVTFGLLATVYGAVEHSIVTAVVGIVVLALFVAVESRTSMPLAPVAVLRQRTVWAGNLAGLVILSMNTAMVYLMTLYLQNVLHLSAALTGVLFGGPGLAAVFSGLVAGRLIGRYGYRWVLVVAMLVQGVAILPLVLVGPSRGWAILVVITLFVVFFGHVAGIVSYMVTSTSGLTPHDQGLASSLTTLTQQVAISVGIPALSAVASTQTGPLAGTRLALIIDVAVTIACAVGVGAALRPRSRGR